MHTRQTGLLRSATQHPAGIQKQSLACFVPRPSVLGLVDEDLMVIYSQPYSSGLAETHSGFNFPEASELQNIHRLLTKYVQ